MGLDDLGVVDSAEVHGGDGEVGVTELSLDDQQRHSVAGHLHRMRVAKLVRREPTAHPSSTGSDVQLGSDAGRCPRSATCGTAQHAEQRPDGDRRAQLQPRLELLSPPPVHADLAAFAALAMADQDRASAWVQVALGQRQRLHDPQSGAPQDDYQAA